MKRKVNFLKTLTLSDMWRIFIHRIWVIVLVAVLAVSAVYTAIQLTFVPKYESMAILYIMKEDEGSSSADKVNEYNLAIRAIYDYEYMLKSKTVLETVRRELKDEIDDPVLSSYGSLRNALSISNPTETRLLEIRIVSGSSENSKKIVNTICEVGIEKIEAAMVGDGLATLFEPGEASSRPCNVAGFYTYLLVALVAGVLVYAIFVIIYMFDDKIKTAEEIEEYFSLSVLGDIPDAGDSSGKHHRIYGGHSKYATGTDTANDRKISTEGGRRK